MPAACRILSTDLRISADLPEAMRERLREGKPIITDSEMVRHGIIARMLPPDVEIVCTLNDRNARVSSVARARSRARRRRFHCGCRDLEGAVVVIGNAPTALFALLEALDVGRPTGPRPSSASRSASSAPRKRRRSSRANPRGVPFATLLGRRGGSAMAAAVVNALTAGMNT